MLHLKPPLVEDSERLGNNPACPVLSTRNPVGDRVDASNAAPTQGSVLQLMPREFALLELLLQHRGRVFPRVDILERIVGSESKASDRSIEVVVFGAPEACGCGLRDSDRELAWLGYLIP